MLQIDKFKINLRKIISFKNKNKNQNIKFTSNDNKQKVKSSDNTIESVAISFNDMELKWIENY
jgi:hypothetical protein